MTQIFGSPAGPDGAGGAYHNTVEARRAHVFDGLGGAQGVLRGFDLTQRAGEMAVDISPGAALLGERDATGAASLNRGYHVYADDTFVVPHDPPSVSDRVDAVVAAFVDVEDGAVGTGGLTVGPHVVAIPGTSGVSTAPTDSDITAWLGRGGWIRLYDQPIGSTDTQVDTSAAVDIRPYVYPFAHLFGTSQLVGSGTSEIQMSFGGLREAHPASGGDTANDRLVVTRPGVHSVELYVEWASNNTGDRSLFLNVNGTRLRGQRIGAAPAGGDYLSIVIPATRFALGDVLTGTFWQTSGANLSTVAKEFTLRWLRE